VRTRLSPDEYASLVHGAPVIVWRADHTGRREFVNEAWSRLTGRPLTDGVGERWLEAVHPDDVDTVIGALRAALARGQAIEVEYRLRHADGGWRWWVDSVVPRNGGDGGLVGVSVDIHHRREREDARIAFMSSIAHELRTPLQAVDTYLALLRRKYEQGDPVGPEVFERAAAQFRRFAALIADLADASALERGQRLALVLEPLDLAPLVRSVVGLHRDTILSRDHHRHGAPHQMSLAIDGERFPIRGDAVRLGQVLFNLLENALKYSPGGGEIAIELVTDGQAHHFRVHDRGVGIPEAELPRIRERFFRASNVMRAFSGTGLGLSIIEEIVSGHGGRLEIASTVDVGTIVTVTLPSARAAS